MEEQNYLVVGGSYGIGADMVRMLAKGDGRVFSCARSMPGNNVQNIVEIAFDAVNDPLPLDQLPESLSGVAYCPGTIRLRPFGRLTQEDFLGDYHTNLLGAVNVIQAALPLLKKSPTQSSIVLFSTVAVRTGMPFHASIASAKGAIEGLTRSLAAELAPRIRVNAIAPSLTDTPLAKQLLANKDKIKAAADRHPLKSIGQPEDIARLAVFLLKETASWISGQVIHIDGGMGTLRTFK
jgi:NAD(P)-dependent dehydrogenase (short-subunit alcohol dehydrogenase family)